jgi:hypothetical protein
MSGQKDELIAIVTKFAESGWDVIDIASKTWLDNRDDNESSKMACIELIHAIEKADKECGSCGCEFDPLYKRALVLLKTV